MNIKKYRQVRAIVALFIAAIVSISVIQNSQILAIIGIFTGMLFLVLVRTKTKIVIDEREKTIKEKAANFTYAIYAPTIGIGSFILITLGRKVPYLFALGQVFAYLALFMIAIYAISYYFLNKQYGGGNEEQT